MTVREPPPRRSRPGAVWLGVVAGGFGVGVGFGFGVVAQEREGVRRRRVGLGVIDDDSGLRLSTLPAWVAAVSRLGAALARGEGPALDARDVLLLLRPFLWYVHELSFQDIADDAAASLHVLNRRREALLEDPEVREDFLALGLLLAAFLEEESLDPSGWTKREGPVERAAMASGRRLAAHLGDDAVLLKLTHTLEVLGAAKRAALACIAALGSRCAPQLDLIPALDPEDQRLVLDALADHAGHPALSRLFQKARVRSGSAPSPRAPR